MQALTTEEMEFVININGTDRHTADVFTDDPVWQDRIKRAGWEPYKINGISRWYTIPVRRLISLRSKDEKITEAKLATRKAAGERLSAARLRRIAATGA